MNSQIVNRVISNLLKDKDIEGNIELKIKVNVNTLIRTILFQQLKGISKYGHSIDECPNDKYNWYQMKIEEIADYLIYKEKEKEKEKEIEYNKTYNDFKWVTQCPNCGELLEYHDGNFICSNCKTKININ